MPDEDFYKFLLAAFGCMNENLADDGSIYVFHADTQGLNFVRMEAEGQARVVFRQEADDDLGI